MQKKTNLPPQRTRESPQRLVHELEVNQVELEMQNAELGLARDVVEEALEKYSDLYDFAPVGYPTMIDEHGLSVLPISSLGFDYPVSSARVPTGIDQLDAMLGEKGYYSSSSILVSGSAGASAACMSPSKKRRHRSPAAGENCWRKSNGSPAGLKKPNRPWPPFAAATWTP